MPFRLHLRPLSKRTNLPGTHLPRTCPLTTTTPFHSIPKPSNPPPSTSKTPTRPRPLHLPPLAPTPPETLTEAFLKGSGPGGQKINKTSSAVQLKHLPTGIVIKCQATRSRSQNRKIARRLLAERLEVLEKGAEARVSVKGERERKRKASRGKKARRKYRALGGDQEGEGEGEGEEEGEGDGEGDGDDEAVRDGEEWLDEGEGDIVGEESRKGGATEERLVGYVAAGGVADEGEGVTDIVKSRVRGGKIRKDGKWIKTSKLRIEEEEVHQARAVEESSKDKPDDTREGKTHQNKADDESLEDGHDGAGEEKDHRDEKFEKWLQEELEIKEIAAQSTLEPGEKIPKKKKKKKKEHEGHHDV